MTHEGWFGLVRASELFDPARAVPFEKYAKRWIRARIQNAVRNQYGIVRVSLHVHRNYRRERAGTLDPIIDLTSEQRCCLDAGRPLLSSRHQSLANPRFALHEESDQDDLLTNPRFAVHDEPDQDDRDFLATAIAALPDQERDVIRLRYGLGCEPMTLRDIGVRLGMSYEWVRKLEIRAINRIRADHGIEAEAGKSY